MSPTTARSWSTRTCLTTKRASNKARLFRYRHERAWAAKARFKPALLCAAMQPAFDRISRVLQKCLCAAGCGGILTAVPQPDSYPSSALEFSLPMANFPYLHSVARVCDAGCRASAICLLVAAWTVTAVFAEPPANGKIAHWEQGQVTNLSGVKVTLSKPMLVAR